tara:strand:- start:10093 stop:10722 length:630 start_codon:yes stop_codon:yes gene_type:complete
MTLSLELKNLDQIQKDIFKALSLEVNKRTKKNTARVSRELKGLVKGWVEQTPEMMSLQAQGLPGSLNATFGLPPGNPQAAVSAISNAVAESMEINIQRVNAKLEGSVTFNFVSSTFGLLLGLPQGHQQTEYGTDLHWLDWLLTKGDAVVVQGFMYEPSNGGRSGGGSMKLGGYFKVPSQFSGVPTDNFITRAFQGKEKQISAVLNKYLV